MVIRGELELQLCEISYEICTASWLGLSGCKLGTENEEVLSRGTPNWGRQTGAGTTQSLCVGVSNVIPHSATRWGE